MATLAAHISWSYACSVPSRWFAPPRAPSGVHGRTIGGAVGERRHVPRRHASMINSPVAYPTCTCFEVTKKVSTCYSRLETFATYFLIILQVVAPDRFLNITARYYSKRKTVSCELNYKYPVAETSNCWIKRTND